MNTEEIKYENQVRHRICAFCRYILTTHSTKILDINKTKLEGKNVYEATPFNRHAFILMHPIGDAGIEQIVEVRPKHDRKTLRPSLRHPVQIYRTVHFIEAFEVALGVFGHRQGEEWRPVQTNTITNKSVSEITNKAG